MMATVVLVPGSWAGGWIWQPVATHLRQTGHKVFTPTLTGLGERVHLAHPGVNLETHITDIVNVVSYEDLDEVVLVGHSYGGMVITGVAERLTERIKQLVYLDADVPEDGQTGYEAEGYTVNDATADEAAAIAAGTPGFAPVPIELIAASVPDVAQRTWLLARLTPHPLATYQHPIRLGNLAAAGIARTFVLCTQEKDVDVNGSLQTAHRVRHATGWDYQELAANHAAPITAPVATAELLHSLLI